MKKLFYSIVIIGSITVGLTSCGGSKKEEAKEEENTEEASDEYEIAEPERGICGRFDRARSGLG